MGCCEALLLGLLMQPVQAAEQVPSGQELPPQAEGRILPQSCDAGIVDAYDASELPDGLGGWQTIPPAPPPEPESADALDVCL